MLRCSRPLERVLFVFAILALIVPLAAPSVAGGVMVKAVRVLGNAHVSVDRILDVVSTKAGDPFDRAKVQNDLRAISELGFFASQMPPLIEQRDGGVTITFRVVENPVIRSIRFEGNHHVSADTLLALMDTASGQVFNVRTYQQDVLKINSYYDKRGYGGQLPTHVADVEITPAGELTLRLQEGLTVRHVVITTSPDADPALPAPAILGALVTKAGGAYSDEQRDKDYDALKELYKKHDLQIADFEAGIDPDTVDMKNGTADVRYSIFVARVGAIEITGNTATHDDVIRRELRLLPGMIVTSSAIHRDYDRLNNLGYFAKVDVEAKQGPDPKRPGLVTLDWQVKEQRTGTATIGAGYSGGATGTGLTGTLSYAQNNINGTGNGASIKFERGSRAESAQLDLSIPHLGKTEKSQKFSLTNSIYTQQQISYLSVYSTNANGSSTSSGIPVSLLGSSSSQLVSGVYSTYWERTDGISTILGQRLNDIYTASVGANVQRISATASVPSGYYFPTSQALNVATTTSSSLLGTTSTLSTALGITAPSIATIDSSKPYQIHSAIFGIAADSRDDVANPRHGVSASLRDELSSTSLGSNFNYNIVTLDAARFFPLRNSTLGLHVTGGFTTGAIPTSKLFIITDQQLRGYSTEFYGTDELIGQAELRIPLTPDRKFAIAAFGDGAATRIRGGTSLNTFQYHGDLGLGLRFDIPQLGLKTLRLDFAKGRDGMHTSFGIGQSF